MSGGATPLEQGLPREASAGSAAWTPLRQPVPVIDRFEPKEGLTNDAAAGNVLHAREVLLEGLEQEYVLENGPILRSFLRARPTAIALLFEAAPYIKDSFGQECVKAIRLVTDGLEGASVFGIVFWPGPTERAREALANFDQRWWLRNCNRAGGAVNFNIELT